MRWIVLSIVLLSASGVWSQGLMYPGDANNDGTADHIDLLPVGIAYGATFIPRDDPSLEWIEQFFIFWDQILPVTGVNYGFIDGDGNGIIDSLDIDPIALNYDSLQMMSDPPPAPYMLPETLFVAEVPQLIFSFEEDTAEEGDTVRLRVDYFYPESMPPTAGTMGTAFTIAFDEHLVKDSLTTFFPNQSLGDLMFVTATPGLADVFRSPDPGTIELAACGRGTPALTSSRTLLEMDIIIEDMILTLQDRDTLIIDVPQKLLLTLDELVIELGVVPDSLVILNILGGNEAAPFVPEISVFPNPASDHLYLSGNGESPVQVRLFDWMGKEWLNRSFQGGTIPLRSIPSGSYFLEIQSDSWRVVKKVIIVP
jgi:hypothetical protein